MEFMESTTNDILDSILDSIHVVQSVTDVSELSKKKSLLDASCVKNQCNMHP